MARGCEPEGDGGRARRPRREPGEARVAAADEERGEAEGGDDPADHDTTTSAFAACPAAVT